MSGISFFSPFDRLVALLISTCGLYIRGISHSGPSITSGGFISGFFEQVLRRKLTSITDFEKVVSARISQRFPFSLSFFFILNTISRNPLYHHIFSHELYLFQLEGLPESPNLPWGREREKNKLRKSKN